MSISKTGNRNSPGIGTTSVVTRNATSRETSTASMDKAFDETKDGTIGISTLVTRLEQDDTVTTITRETIEATSGGTRSTH